MLADCNVVPVLVMVNTRTPALSLTLTSATAKLGWSDVSVIVPKPWLSLIVALVALDKLMLKVSLPSKTASLLMVTVIVAWVWLAVKVNVPLFAT